MPSKNPPRRNPKRACTTESVDQDESASYSKKLRKKMLLAQKCSDSKFDKNEEVNNNKHVEISSKLSQECREGFPNRTDFSIDFAKRQTNPVICKNWMFPYLEHSLNIVHHHYRASAGLISHPNINRAKAVAGSISHLVSNFQLYRTGSPFNRRVTALEWHPTNPRLLAAGSKGGDIYLWNVDTVDVSDKFIHGIGAGGSIQAMKFWPWDDQYILTSSIDGRVALHDFSGRKTRILTDTLNCLEFWYCSVDASASRKIVVAGDNVGNTVLLGQDGKQLWKHKLHSGKVTHTEFSPREDWLLCTASIDKTVKMWDVRMISGKKSALCTLRHDKGVNSAYFSQTDGCRLLTTDQGSNLHVFQGPAWIQERVISHPHRFFQHITPIKAAWHPLQDIIVVGRYPERMSEGEKRTVDLFDASSGKMVSQLSDQSAPGIVSLNKFCPQGDRLASGMGASILIWSRHEDIIQKQKALLAKFKGHRVNTSDVPNRRVTKRKPQLQAKTLNTSKISTKVKDKKKKL